MAQTYSNWECIIVNDGSPDNSEAIALGYCSTDDRFKYIKKQNGGLSSARNAGLKMAAGTWIQFLDADDYIAPEKLEQSMLLIMANPEVSIIVSDFRMFVNEPTTYTGPFCKIEQSNLNFEGVLFGWDSYLTIPIHCGLFNAALFSNISFVETLKSNEDWIMWLNIFQNGGIALYLDSQLAYYRNNPDSMTKDIAFARTNQITAFQYIIKFLPDEYVKRFACHILDGVRFNISTYESDIKILKTKLSVRLIKRVRAVFQKRKNK